MVIIIASVYGIVILLAIIGVLLYRSKIKKNGSKYVDTKMENTGMPISGGVEHLKIICK